MKTFDSYIDAHEYSLQNPTELTECKKSHKGGSIKRQGYYLNGVKHGKGKWFYDDGSLWEMCFFLNDEPHGEYNWFYPDGSLKSQCFYKNGQLHGEFKEYYQNGSIEEHIFYLNNIKQPQLQYLTTERDEITLTLLFGDNYI